ncbi:hypothetical protein, partial [Aeromicrobium tamlense]|uniref:hypothetical protein n=1 Tax=Aeromicrobium tamlense TaxID=375541 RepID=UPI0031D073A2
MTRKTTRDDSSQEVSNVESSESNRSDIHGDLTGFQRDLLLEAARFYDANGYYPKGVALKESVE